jgi:translocator protein
MTIHTEHRPPLPLPRMEITTLLVFFGIAFIPAIIGMATPPDAWFGSLTKPAWNPPSWLFGPVWTILYALIGYAGYLAWNSSMGQKRNRIFSIYASQLFLNALWTPLFFGYHSTTLALIDITALWTTIALNIVAFYRIKPAAGLLLIPYWLWVTFAWVLNFSIWNLNA